MNNTAQNDDANVQNQPQVAQPIQQPVSPVGSTQKEALVSAPVSEFVKPTEEAPEIHPDVKEAGVEVSPNHETPNLTLEDKKAGLGLAKESTPVSTQPSSVQYPMTSSQAHQALKLHKRVGDSVRWLALIILRQLKKQNKAKQL